MATGGGDDYQKALVDNFMAVTGADAERASFFLQSAAWNLQVMNATWLICSISLLNFKKS